eukprot:364498-Chlamydomonas_euryale.AAC.4
MDSPDRSSAPPFTPIHLHTSTPPHLQLRQPHQQLACLLGTHVRLGSRAPLRSLGGLLPLAQRRMQRRSVRSQPTRLQFQAAKDRQFQAAKDRQFQATKDRQFQAAKDRQFQAAKDRQFQAAKDRQFQATKDRQFQATKDRQFQAAKDRHFQTGNGHFNTGTSRRALQHGHFKTGTSSGQLKMGTSRRALQDGQFKEDMSTHAAVGRQTGSQLACLRRTGRPPVGRPCHMHQTQWTFCMCFILQT